MSSPAKTRSFMSVTNRKILCSKFMKQPVLLLLALAALGSLNSGCQTGGAYAPVNTNKYNYETTATFVDMDPGTQRSVTCSGIQKRALPDGRMEVAANVRNRE